MSASNGTDRVTNKQLYDELNNLRQEVSTEVSKLPTRRELYMAIGSALVLGQIAARFDIATLRFPEPTQTAVELLARVFS